MPELRIFLCKIHGFGSISFSHVFGAGSSDQHLDIVDPDADPRIHLSGIVDPDPDPDPLIHP